MTLEILPVEGIGEVLAGDDLAALVVAGTGRSLRHGDVLVVTSKVVSKAAGLTESGSRPDLLEAQTDRVVARRGQMQISRTHHGLTLAAAGVDASNTPGGTVVPLPPDPDESARQLRTRVAHLCEADVAVVISDTAGRAWRTGQTDIAVGAAGLSPVVDLAGEHDPFGNPLEVTAPAVADEIAAAADLVTGKLTGCPAAVVRGVPRGWLTEDDGPGASALIRDEASDLFGLGAVEAVRLAVAPERPVRGFPAPQPSALETVVTQATGGVDEGRVTVAVLDHGLEVSLVGDPTPQDWVTAGGVLERLRILSAAFGIDVPVRLDESGAGEPY